jgi:hypothetical protein
MAPQRDGTVRRIAVITIKALFFIAAPFANYFTIRTFFRYFFTTGFLPMSAPFRP